ncbi:MAG: flagellar FliJ family protein [Ignavibacteriales bacterium]|nr:flagellar FliJ family protein [Ignavibacteriales bacterium]MCB9209394.1 flagellar FliJ family protein [Ignavibacteriales bacterium]MCB9258037.1 flagellar FliJ family protein [Ignavibacteriales bacterium]
MANFKYKFKTIKDVKQRLEKKTQKELAVIELDISNKKEEILIINEKLKENRKKKNESRIKKITELHFYEKYENYLEEQIKLIQKYINKKTVERNKKIEELIKKSKETKTFEKLEDKHLAEFVKVQEKMEQKELDEFAVIDFLKE